MAFDGLGGRDRALSLEEQLESSSATLMALEVELEHRIAATAAEGPPGPSRGPAELTRRIEMTRRRIDELRRRWTWQASPLAHGFVLPSRRSR
jgi:hypothetical protein